MYPGIELRLQRCAVVLAEELSFTQAARRLHLAQPALSRAIRQLEGYLKVTLFIRSTRKVELTDPGRKFVYEARKAVHYSERAMQIAVRQKRKDSPKLIVGYPSFCDLEFIAELTKLNTHLMPGGHVIYHSSSEAEVLDQIALREWHCGIIDMPVVSSDLQTVPLFRSPLTAALRSDHPLAQRRTLNLRELRNQPILLPARSISAALVSWFETKCQDRGFEPQVVHEVSSPPEAICLAAKGAGIALARKPVFGDAQPNVVCLPFSDRGLTIETALVFARGTISTFLQTYLDTVVRFGREYARRKNLLPRCLSA